MKSPLASLGRAGMKAKKVPVEVERDETIITKDEQGDYVMGGRTPSDAPKHEDGGVKLELNEGDLVFPKKYDKELNSLIAGDGAIVDQESFGKLKDKMLFNANKAAESGKPYSSGGFNDNEKKVFMKNEQQKNGGKAYGKGGKVCGCGSKMRNGGNCMKCGGKAMRNGGILKFAPGGEIPEGSELPAIRGTLATIKNANIKSEEDFNEYAKLVTPYGETAAGAAMYSILDRKKMIAFGDSPGYKITDDDKNVAKGVATGSQSKLEGSNTPLSPIAMYLSGKADDVSDDILSKAITPYNTDTGVSDIGGSKAPTSAGAGAGAGNIRIGKVKHPGNRGSVSGQQEILNDLINTAKAKGMATPGLLQEDDVMGANTRAAMQWAEKSGQYKTPALLSSANVEQYKKNWGGMSAEEKQTALNAGNKAVGPDNAINYNWTKEGSVTNPLKKIDATGKYTGIPMSGAKGSGSWKQDMFGYMKGTKEGNEENLVESGFKKMSLDGTRIIDGDTIEKDGVVYRLQDIDKSNAFFDAAESAYFKDGKRVGQASSDGKNMSKKMLEDALKGGKDFYMRDLGEKAKDGRNLASVYYSDPQNPGLYHSSDSLLATKGQAVYGNGEKYPKTERQNSILANAEMPFQYNENPSDWRYNFKLDGKYAKNTKNLYDDKSTGGYTTAKPKEKEKAKTPNIYQQTTELFNEMINNPEQQGPASIPVTTKSPYVGNRGLPGTLEETGIGETSSAPEVQTSLKTTGKSPFSGGRGLPGTLPSSTKGIKLMDSNAAEATSKRTAPKVGKTRAAYKTGRETFPKAEPVQPSSVKLTKEQPFLSVSEMSTKSEDYLNPNDTAAFKEAIGKKSSAKEVSTYLDKNLAYIRTSLINRGNPAAANDGSTDYKEFVKIYEKAIVKMKAHGVTKDVSKKALNYLANSAIGEEQRLGYKDMNEELANLKWKGYVNKKKATSFRFGGKIPKLPKIK